MDGTRKDYDEFLHSAPNTALVGEVTDAVQRIQNARVRLRWMAAAARQLAKDSCPEELRHALVGPADEADRYLALERTTVHRLESREDELAAHTAALKGGTMMAFPAECSGPDAQRRLAAMLDDEAASDAQRALAHRILSILDDGAVTEDILQGTAVMWWSGKPLARDAELHRFTGRNDKTKIVVKLTKEGASAPPREPAVDAKAQAELMAFYFRKQEEEKKLVDDDDIAFGNSEWANPHGLKNQLLGFEGVKFKPR